MVKRKQTFFNLFNVSLYGGKAVTCEIFIEDNINTEKYCRDEDISFPLLNECVLSHFDDKRARYSYWNWISDIVNSDVEICVLLDGESWAFCYEEKNIHLHRPFIQELIKLNNFYYIHFQNIELLPSEEEIKKTFVDNQKKTIEKELRTFYQIIDNKDRFKDYWTYSPNKKSFIRLFLLGLFEVSLRFNFDVLYTDIVLKGSKQENFETVFDLFNTRLTLPGIHANLLFKLKEEETYKLFFIIDNDRNRVKKKLQSILKKYIIDQIHGLEDFQYNFKIPDINFLRDTHDFNSADDYRSINIEINSLVVGLYSHNVEYWTLFTHLLGSYHSGLFYTDYLLSEPINSNGEFWFAGKDVTYPKNYDIFHFLFIR